MWRGTKSYRDICRKRDKYVSINKDSGRNRVCDK